MTYGKNQAKKFSKIQIFPQTVEVGLAHNLRGSAQAASIASIEDVSIALESLLSDLRDSDFAADVAGSEKLRQYLRTLNLELDRLAKSADAPSAAAVRLERCLTGFVKQRSIPSSRHASLPATKKWLADNKWQTAEPFAI